MYPSRYWTTMSPTGDDDSATPESGGAEESLRLVRRCRSSVTSERTATVHPRHFRFYRTQIRQVVRTERAVLSRRRLGGQPGPGRGYTLLRATTASTVRGAVIARTRRPRRGSAVWYPSWGVPRRYSPSNYICVSGPWPTTGTDNRQSRRGVTRPVRSDRRSRYRSAYIPGVCTALP